MDTAAVNELRNPDTITIWAERLLHECLKALERMDALITLAEAKIAMTRRVRSRREQVSSGTGI